MPLYDFACPVGHYFEELVRGDAPDALECVCGRTAKRGRVYLVTPVGPRTTDLESFEQALLTEDQRADGASFSGKAAIEKWESDRKLSRVDRGSQAYRQMMEYQHEEVAAEIHKANREDGPDAAFDVVGRRNVMDVTGWSKERYRVWKEANDAVESNVARGYDPEAVAGGGRPASDG